MSAEQAYIPPPPPERPVHGWLWRAFREDMDWQTRFMLATVALIAVCALVGWLYFTVWGPSAINNLVKALPSLAPAP